MKKQTFNPTLFIKAKFSNAVHKLLEPNIDLKHRDRYMARRKQGKLTPEQKVELFDKIVALHSECSNELTNYLFNRREKNRIQKARHARGWQPKPKQQKQN